MSQLRKKLLNPNLRKRYGFTLIELLVVIAIIGILSVLVLAALGTARKKARASSAKAKVQSIANGLEMYYDDNNSYPGSLNWGGSLVSGGTTYIGNLPQQQEGDIRYEYSGGGTSYSLTVTQSGNTIFTCDPNGCR